MTKMPMSIWARKLPDKPVGQWIDHDKPHFKTTKYTNTAQAIEAIKGMMKEPMHNNTTLQDVIDMLEKE